MVQLQNKITHNDKMLFIICWLVYFFTYFGRMNYAACLTQIIITENFSKALAGLIGTAFFITYGIGQLISGFLGDYLSPRWMIFVGVFFSGICNFLMGYAPTLNLMIIIWCINGFFQSLIWSPIVRLFAQYFNTYTRGTLGVYINSTVPIGTLGIYAFTTLVLKLTQSWRIVFISSAVILIFTAFLWLLATAYLLPKLQLIQYASNDTQIIQNSKSFAKIFLSSGMIFMCMVLLMQGMLKEGITTWIPTFLYEKFSLTTSLAIVSTALIPLLNICGITLAAFTRNKLKDEVKASLYLFILGTLALLCLYIASFINIILTFIFFALATTLMMAVNTVYVGVMPGYFANIGKSSLVSGILNAFVNLGIALSTFGFGALSTYFSWNFTMLSWIICGLIGILTSSLAYNLWKKYKTSFSI